MRVRYFFLIIALMFTMTACTSRTAEPTDTSSSATSAPGPVVQATTWPTEMTTEFLEEVTPADLMPTRPVVEPPPEKFPIPHSFLNDANWELIGDGSSGSMYRYNADVNPLVFKDLFELTLPESWIGSVRVYVIDHDTSLRIRVYSIPLAEAFHVIRPEIEGTEYLLDPVMDIYIKPKTVNGDLNVHAGTPTLETDEWSLEVVSREARDLDCYTEMIDVFYFIDQYGQEAYDEAVGDITCTQEEAEAMVSLIN